MSIFVNCMIDVVIVEDDPSLSDSLELILEDFEEVRVLAVAQTVKEAVKYIDKLKPTLLFLDVVLPDGTGFDILKQIKHNNFKVVFTTSYADFAIRAFELSALHYLLKPISIEMIEEVFRRYSSLAVTNNINNRLAIAENSFNNKVDKIMLHTNSGCELFYLNEIVRIEADQNYSNVVFQNSDSILISKNIKYFEELLEEFGFCRVHHSYLINIEHVKKYQKGRYPTITMSDGYEVRIADSKKQFILDKLSARVLQG